MTNAPLVLQGDRSMESLYAELVSNGVLVRAPAAHIQD